MSVCEMSKILFKKFIFTIYSNVCYLLFIALILPHFLYSVLLSIFIVTSVTTSMARNSLLCADVPLRNYSLTHVCFFLTRASLFVIVLIFCVFAYSVAVVSL